MDLLRLPRRTTCIIGLYGPGLVHSGLGEHLCYCIIIRLFRTILDISKGKKGKHMPLCIQLSLYCLYTKGETLVTQVPSSTSHTNNRVSSDRLLHGLIWAVFLKNYSISLSLSLFFFFFFWYIRKVVAIDCIVNFYEILSEIATCMWQQDPDVSSSWSWFWD